MAVAPRIGGVNQNDVEVAGQAAVLEAVVQDKEFAFQLAHSGLREGYAIRILKVWNVGQVLFQNERLIVAAVAGSVTSAEDRNTQIVLAVEASDVLDTRRLAGA